jgi:peptidoglycan/LPS O-acetylase OafA/YrhL
MWLCYGGPTWYFILSFLFLANFSMAFNVSIPHGADVFWSLAVEEHFYLIWPWLVRFLTRRGLTIFACCVVVLVPCLRVWAAQLGVIPEKIYSYSYFRFDELALGALLAIWVRSAYARRFSSLKAAGLLLCACAVVTLVGLPFGIMERHSVLRYIQAELGFGSLVLGAFALQGSRFTAPLRWSFAKMSGDLSYCMYLIHLGLGDCFEHFRKLLGIDFGGSPAGLKVVFVRGAFMLFATLSLAWLSRRFLEGPMLRLKAHFEYEGSARQPAGAVTDGAAPR